jgi:hypothetical protein
LICWDREKEAKIEQSPTLRPLAAQLQSVYQTLRELAQTQFSALTTPKHLQPELFSLEEVFTQWPPKDIRTPKIHETPHSTVTVVDFSSSNEVLFFLFRIPLFEAAFLSHSCPAG